MSHGVIVQDYLELSGLPLYQPADSLFLRERAQLYHLPEAARRLPTYSASMPAQCCWRGTPLQTLARRWQARLHGCWLTLLEAAAKHSHSVCSSAHFRATQLEHGPCSFSWVALGACMQPSWRIPRSTKASGVRGLPVVSEHSTYSDIAADLSKVTGLTVK